MDRRFWWICFRIAYDDCKRWKNIAIVEAAVIGALVAVLITKF